MSLMNDAGHQHIGHQRGLSHLLSVEAGAVLSQQVLTKLLATCTSTKHAPGLGKPQAPEDQMQPRCLAAQVRV